MTKELDLGEVKKFQRKFIAERAWEPFHTPKNIVMALAGEAGELSEIFQWLNEKESFAITHDPDKRPAVADELADLLYYVVRLADLLAIDLDQAFWDKMRRNEAKYPVALAKGNAKKYTEF